MGVQQFMLGNAELAVDDEGNAGLNLIALVFDLGHEGPPSEV